MNPRLTLEPTLRNIVEPIRPTATEGAYLRCTLDGSTPTSGPSGNGTQIPAARGSVLFTVGPREKTLQAIVYKEGLPDSSIAVGTYIYESPY
jgi:hypothetical protein